MDFDGVEIFRSTKRYSGYGKEPFFDTSKDAYYNTAIEAGTKYYYKVRGYVMADGEKVLYRLVCQGMENCCITSSL